MTGSRMTAIGLLAAGLVFAAGCNRSKPNDEAKAEGGTSDPNVKIGGGPQIDPPPGPPPVVATHEMDPAKHAVPPGPAAGRLTGSAFAPAALIDGESLVFSTPKTAPGGERKVALKLAPTAPNNPFENRKVVIRPTDPAGPTVPEVWVERADRPDAPEVFRNGIALTLTLGARRNGKVPGAVYLCLPDERQTFLAGEFTADFPRLPTEPAGPDDVPYVQGAVAVRGAPPDARLEVGYAAHPRPDLLCFGQSQVTLAPLVAGNPRTVREATHENPRVLTTVVAGDGTSVPGRFDHAKLPPGRYLVYATLAGGGPVAWKWVTVTPNSAVTVDFAIEANLTGGVEVVVPATTIGKVQAIPAEEPGGAIDTSLAAVIVLQLGLERDIVARKVLYKNLAPGRYEVRAGGEARTVEVVAGKTAELDFDKKPAPPKPDPEPKAKS